MSLKFRSDVKLLSEILCNFPVPVHFHTSVETFLILHFLVFIFEVFQNLFCRDMFCAGRVEQADMDRLIAACGGTVLTTVSQISKELLGSCAEFYEQQVGSERYCFYFCIYYGAFFWFKN